MNGIPACGSARSSRTSKVPTFLPDTEIVRRDLLDYAVEVEWGDTQIGRALKLLEDGGRARRTRWSSSPRITACRFRL